MSGAPIDRALDAVEWVGVRENEGPSEDGGLYATHEGVLRLGMATFRVYQLNDGTRVFDAADLEEFLTGYW
jgi:hypothetical protein